MAGEYSLLFNTFQNNIEYKEFYIVLFFLKRLLLGVYCCNNVVFFSCCILHTLSKVKAK
jgi:hypothetical protein